MPDFYVTAEDTPLTVDAPGVLGNDSDPDGDPLSVVWYGQPVNGTVSMNPDGSFTYTPNENFWGVDIFAYTVCDTYGLCDTAYVEFCVEHVNHPPEAMPDFYVTAEDTPLTVDAPGVLGNDSDPDGDPLSVVWNSQPYDGTVSMNPDGSFTYTPNENFWGVDSFHYAVCDTYGLWMAAPVDIFVVDVNDPPVVTADQPTVTTDEGQVATNSGAVSDVDGDTVTLDASVGTVINHGDGAWSWTFETADGPAESQTVTISAADGHGGIDWTWFALTVNNVPPGVGPVSAPAEPVVVGTEVTASASFSDPGVDDAPFICTVNYGDGSGDLPGTVSGNTCTGPIHPCVGSGSYTIEVAVTDKDGGQGLATHPLTVLSPSQAIESVGDEVETLDLPQGLENALTSKLNNALDDLDRGQDHGAVGKLNAFVNSVEAQRGKKISAAEADALIQTAQEIIGAINAGLL